MSQNNNRSHPPERPADFETIEFLDQFGEPLKNPPDVKKGETLCIKEGHHITLKNRTYEIIKTYMNERYGHLKVWLKFLSEVKEDKPR